ncbi:hypothetical protein Aduo_000616 [Ancylostoma duodenale]
MSEEDQTVTIRLYSTDVPRLCITYKDKNELYREFQKQLKKLNVSADSVYFLDNDIDRHWIRSADTLYAIVDRVHHSKMYISDSGCADERKGTSKKRD